MILATSYPFLEVFWTMLIFFAFVIWIWILITVSLISSAATTPRDSRRSCGSSSSSILPYFGVFVYLIVEHKGMTERAIKQQDAQSQMDQYVQSVAATDRPGRADRQGQGAARRRHDLAGRVRPDQAEGAGRELANSRAGGQALAPTPACA